MFQHVKNYAVAKKAHPRQDNWFFFGGGGMEAIDIVAIKGGRVWN
jgi:hypothetical protein